MFSQDKASAMSGNASFDELVNDFSRPEADRAADIARAVNDAGNPDSYFEFRAKQIEKSEALYNAHHSTHAAWQRFWDASKTYAEGVEELKSAGDDKLLEQSPALQADGAALRDRRKSLQTQFQTQLNEMQQTQDVLSVLVAAEQKMTPLQQEDIKNTVFSLNALKGASEGLTKMFGNMPPENNELEIALIQSRNATVARQEAIESSARKAILNTYLKTGFITETKVAAPKTARFTRKARQTAVPIPS